MPPFLAPEFDEVDRTPESNTRNMSMPALSADKKAAYDAAAVTNFREYLRIPSVQPDVNYDDCVKFLKAQAVTLGLPCRVYIPIPKKPIVIITWEGSDPKLPAVLLNSHMDVVPVFENDWTYAPFGAEMDEQGRIYARGAQDMKCVGIQYLEAMRRMKESGVVPLRTLHCCFVPDEEIGGELGMRHFVTTQEFRDLKIGFSLDEGMSSDNDDFLLYYAERCIWQILFVCTGQSGHGSLLHENTAAEKLKYIFDKILERRDEEKAKLKNNTSLTIGDVMTLNVTILKGGVQANVVPPEFSLMMDCRVPLGTDEKQWFATLEQWCKDAGDGVTLVKHQKNALVPATKLDNTNAYWMAFKESADKLGLRLDKRVFPGGTDSRYIRQIGIPALGFSPINNTPVLLHDNDEFLEKSVFLRGIEIYCELIGALANVPDCTG